MSEATVIQGDCLDVLARMPTGSVDAVVTDPPYGTGGWLRPGTGQKPEKQREAWDTWSTAWLAEAGRVCTGTIALFCPSVVLLTTTMTAALPGRAPRLLFWAKPNPLPRYDRRPAYGFEPIVTFGSLHKVGGKDWFEASAPRHDRGHPHQKPVTLMRWLCRLVTPPGGHVLDPFTGSGTTGVACMLEGFQFTGIERETEYVALANRRITDAAAQGDLWAAEAVEEQSETSVKRFSGPLSAEGDRGGCVRCGAPFLRRRGGSLRRFCSSQCRWEAWAQRRYGGSKGG